MKSFIKLILTVALFVLAFRVVDFDSVKRITMGVNVEIALLGVIFQLASTVLAAYRWSLIMQALAFHERFFYYVGSYFKGMFFNQALPGSIGGDAVRVLELGAKGYSKKEAFFGIFLDRIVGLAGLLVLNLVANLLSPDLLPAWMFHLITMITAGGLASFVILLGLKKITLLRATKITSMVADLSSRFGIVYNGWRGVGLQVGLSVAIHFLSIVALYEIARAVGMRLTLDVFLVAVPPVFLLTILPISLAGWGVREGAMVAIFMMIGANKEMILSVSILYGVMLIVSSLPGVVVWLRGKKLV